MLESMTLFVAAYLAAALSGAAGFGGALLLLPLLVAAVGVDQTTPLLARITRHSCARLGLQPGQPVFAQVKTVALMD